MLVALNVDEPPGQIDCVDAVGVIVGFGFTITDTVSVFTHDAAVVAVTVYNVVVTGVTVGEPLKLPGFHKYVVPATVLVALNVDDFPRQMADGVDVGVITGIGLTVTNIVAEFEQPPLVA